MKPRFLFAALAAVYGSYSAGAHAQAFLGDPRLSEGKGIQAGAFELHPGIAAEGGYDSNFFVKSGRGPNDPVPADKVAGRTTGTPVYQAEPVINSYRLRITPSLSFTTFGKRENEQGGGAARPTLIFGGRLAAAYNHLFPLGDQADAVADQNNVALLGGLNLNVFPDRVWGGDASIDYTRVVDASNDEAVSTAFRRNSIRGAVGINWRPGGGLFSWRLGYGVTANLFEEAEFKNLNNVQHRLETSGRWKFLPRTALFYRGDIGWLSYTAGNAPQSLSDGVSLRSQLGMNGLMTNYFGLLVLAGWQSSFWEPNGGVPARNYDSITGQAELSWYPTPQKKLPDGSAPVGLSQVSLGYVRSFSPSYLGSFYQRDRVYLNTIYFFAQRFVLSLSGGYNHISRPESFFPVSSQPTWTDVERLQYVGGADNRVDGAMFFEYRPSASVGINLTLRADVALNEVAVKIVPSETSPYDDIKFARYQAFIGLRWFL
jgi:hypothetical protein